MDWRLFDAERGLEVRGPLETGDYEIRRSENPDVVVPLTPEGWNAFRAGDEEVEAMVYGRLG
jgi:hypothetical protein